MSGQQWVCDSCGSACTVICDDPALGEAGAYDVNCDECAWTAYIPAETTARSRIAAIRQIVNQHGARRVDGYLVDAFTANMLLAVYDALSPSSREKFGKPPLPRLVDFGWKHVR